MNKYLSTFYQITSNRFSEFFKNLLFFVAFSSFCGLIMFQKENLRHRQCVWRKSRTVWLCNHSIIVSSLYNFGSFVRRPKRPIVWIPRRERTCTSRAFHVGSFVRRPKRYIVWSPRRNVHKVEKIQLCSTYTTQVEPRP